MGREKGVRVNSVSQSPTMTTAGQGISCMDRMIDYVDKVSPIGNATADDCADYILMLFSDLTRKVTMQNRTSTTTAAIPIFCLARWNNNDGFAYDNFVIMPQLGRNNY